jgi:hypothetical protein
MLSGFSQTDLEFAHKRLDPFARVDRYEAAPDESWLGVVSKKVVHLIRHRPLREGA